MSASTDATTAAGVFNLPITLEEYKTFEERFDRNGPWDWRMGRNLTGDVDKTYNAILAAFDDKELLDQPGACRYNRSGKACVIGVVFRHAGATPEFLSKLSGSVFAAENATLLLRLGLDVPMAHRVQSMFDEPGYSINSIRARFVAGEQYRLKAAA